MKMYRKWIFISLKLFPAYTFANMYLIYCPPTAECTGQTQDSCYIADKRFKVIRANNYRAGHYTFHDAFAIFVMEIQSAFCNYSLGESSVSFIMDNHPDIRFADWTKTIYPGGSTWSCNSSPARCFFNVFYSD